MHPDIHLESADHPFFHLKVIEVLLLIAGIGSVVLITIKTKLLGNCNGASIFTVGLKNIPKGQASINIGLGIAKDGKGNAVHENDGPTFQVHLKQSAWEELKVLVFWAFECSHYLSNRYLFSRGGDFAQAG